jgi:putative chitinase
MNLPKFFDAIRPMFPGGLTQVQVDVCDSILAGMAGHKIDHVAYVLATAYGEAKMTPTRENMNHSAKRIRQVWPSRPEAVKYAGKPKALANEVYGGRLGNKPGTDDGWFFRGGGVDQLTGRANYAKIGLEHNPERILHPEQAVKSIIHGMTTGRYTGRKLADYDRAGGFDFVQARAIVNGDVKLNGQEYAGYAATFKGALRAAGWPHVNKTPKSEHVAPVVLSSPDAPRGGFWATLFAALIGIIRGK